MPGTFLLNPGGAGCIAPAQCVHDACFVLRGPPNSQGLAQQCGLCIDFGAVIVLRNKDGAPVYGPTLMNWTQATTGGFQVGYFLSDCISFGDHYINPATNLDVGAMTGYLALITYGTPDLPFSNSDYRTELDSDLCPNTSQLTNLANDINYWYNVANPYTCDDTGLHCHWQLSNSFLPDYYNYLGATDLYIDVPTSGFPCGCVNRGCIFIPLPGTPFTSLACPVCLDSPPYFYILTLDSPIGGQSVFNLGGLAGFTATNRYGITSNYHFRLGFNPYLTLYVDGTFGPSGIVEQPPVVGGSCNPFVVNMVSTPCPGLDLGPFFYILQDNGVNNLTITAQYYYQGCWTQLLVTGCNGNPEVGAFIAIFQSVADGTTDHPDCGYNSQTGNPTCTGTPFFTGVTDQDGSLWCPILLGDSHYWWFVIFPPAWQTTPVSTALPRWDIAYIHQGVPYGQPVTLQLTDIAPPPGPPPPPPPSPPFYTLFDHSSAPSNPDSGVTLPYTVGISFQKSVAGHIAAVYFYKSANNTGTHVAGVWNSFGNLMAFGTFKNETTSGWQAFVLSTPVSIQANTRYTVGVYMPNGHFADDENYFTGNYSRSFTDPNGATDVLTVHYPDQDGSFHQSNSLTFPGTLGNHANYWVDVEAQPIFPPIPTGYVCFGGCTDPVSKGLHAQHSLYGPLVFVFDDTNQWWQCVASFFRQATIGQGGVNTCPAQVVTVVCRLFPDAAYQERWVYVDNVDYCPNDNGGQLNVSRWQLANNIVCPPTFVADFSYNTSTARNFGPAAIQLYGVNQTVTIEFTE